jgi:hypothetical protein
MKPTRRKFLYETGSFATGLLLLPGTLRASSERDMDTPSSSKAGTTYYVDTAGNNQNSGTSSSEPWKDFSEIDKKTFAPGDSLLLKRGCVWRDQLTLNGAGSPSQFLVVAAYGTGNRPKIQRDGHSSSRCMRLNNASYVKVSNIEVCNGGAGIVLYYDHSYNNRSVYFDDIVAHDFMGLPGRAEGGPNDRVTWSYGIGVTGVEDTPHNQTRVLSDLRIANTEVYNTGSGIALDWGNHYCVDGSLALSNKFGDVSMENLNLHDNTVDGISFASLFITSVTGCTIKNSTIDKGTKFAPTGTSALQIMFSKDVTLQNVTISNTPFNACPDNTALDFECDNENPTIDGCTFKNNAGPAIEILATPGIPNPYTRNLVVKNCTFIGNNWARKLGNCQISVADWQHGNFPTGAIRDNKYSNAPHTDFFGGDGNTTKIDLVHNTNIGKAELGPRVLKVWKFETDGDFQGWQNGPYSNGIRNLRASGGSLTGTVTGIDPNVVSSDPLNLPLTPETFVEVVIKNGTAALFAQVYFVTDANQAWSETKHRDFWLYPESAGFMTYQVDMSSVAGWTGKLKRLRIDPEQGAASGTFSIRQISILSR